MLLPHSSVEAFAAAFTNAIGSQEVLSLVFATLVV